MKKYKTNPKYRNTYRYYFVNGKSQEIVESDEVTAENISFLHQLDDEEVDRERRENYHIPVHYGSFKPFDREENHLLGAELSPIELFWKTQNHDRERYEEFLQKLREAIKKLTPKQQLTIQKIFYEGMNNSELAQEEGVSETAIRHRLIKIYTNLRKNIC